jgi:lipopolysaccharide assembly protein B
MQQQPRLIAEVVPRLTASCEASAKQNVLTSILEDVRSRGSEASRAVALAAINNRRIDNPVALQCLLDYVVADRVLAKLVSVEQLQNADPVARRAAIDKIREGLAQMFSPAHRYRCKECGYHTSQLVWQCPSCRAWESVEPAVQLNFAH